MFVYYNDERNFHATDWQTFHSYFKVVVNAVVILTVSFVHSV